MKKMELNQKKINTLGLLAIGVVFLAAGEGCSSKSVTIGQVVTNVAVTSYSQDNDDWVKLTATLSTGGFTLAGINLPITDPNDRTRVYGQLSMAGNLCPSGQTCAGGGELTVALNVTQVGSFHSTDDLLPNGTSIPIGGISNSTLVTLPIADTGAKVYFAFGNNIALLGAAVPFAALDAAGQYAPGVNIFAPITIGPVSLSAGMFFGSETKTTGVGLFVDLSNLINKTSGTASMMAMSRSSDATRAWSSSMRGGRFQSQLQFKDVGPSKSKENKIFLKLYDMSKKGGVLKLQ